MVAKTIKLIFFKFLSKLFISQKIDIHPWDISSKEQYQKDIEMAGKWINAFPVPPDFSDKNVMDFGCGIGGLCAYAVLNGAKRVVGVELEKEMCETATNLVKQENPKIKDKVSFFEYASMASSNYTEKADIILSEAAFEHYDPPEEVLNKMVELLNPGGHIYAAFSPLWHAPYGAHLKTICKLPWAHLWGGRWLIDEHNRLRPHKPASSWKSFCLNQASLAHFEKIFHNLKGCQVIHFLYNRPIVSRLSLKIAYFFIEPLRRLPFLREYLTNSLIIVVRKNN